MTKFVFPKKTEKFCWFFYKQILRGGRYEQGKESIVSDNGWLG